MFIITALYWFVLGTGITAKTIILIVLLPICGKKYIGVLLYSNYIYFF